MMSSETPATSPSQPQTGTEASLTADSGVRSPARSAVRVEPGERAHDVSRSGTRRTSGNFPAARIWLPWLLGLAIAGAWDRAVFQSIALKDTASLARLESSDWYRTLRIIGAPYIWLFVAVIFILFDAQRAARARESAGTGATSGESGYFTGRAPAFRRATFLLLSALGSGALAELLKALVGRYKPDISDGWYRFASLHERFVDFRWNDLGFVSSHTATAFGACFALSIMLPRASVLFMLAAIGCATTRLLAGAHYLSDTYGAVLLAFIVTKAVYALDRRNNAGRGIDL